MTPATPDLTDLRAALQRVTDGVVAAREDEDRRLLAATDLLLGKLEFGSGEPDLWSYLGLVAEDIWESLFGRDE
jgi:hypothetical protein